MYFIVLSPISSLCEQLLLLACLNLHFSFAFFVNKSSGGADVSPGMMLLFSIVG